MKWYKAKVMKYFIFLVGLILMVPVALLVLYKLFGGDWRVALPSGYSLVRTYASAILMTDSNQIVIINPSIDGYTISQHLVIGHVTRTEGLLPEDSADSRPGYFIVDIQSGKVREGLEENAWLDSLKVYGILEKPHLRKP